MADEAYTPSVWGARYHALKVTEALGAGAAGPGKTTVLIHDPLSQVAVEHKRLTLPRNHPWYLEKGASVGWALHLRRTGNTLDQTIARTHKIFPRIDPGARWNGEKQTWTFTSGYHYQFGHCKDPNSWENFMSNEYTHLAFDELTQFNREQYDQITTRVRSSDPVLASLLAIRSMSNPLMRRQAGESFVVEDPNWVRRLFVDPAPNGNVIMVRKLKRDDGTEFERTRIYLPARLSDNPNKEFVRQYEESLQDKPAHIRAALLYGDWNVTPDSYYAEAWNPQIHTCEAFTVPRDWAIFRSMDWGFKVEGCVHWWALDPEGTLFCFDELTFKGKYDEQVAELIEGVEKNLKLWQGRRSMLTGPADTQIWEQRGSTTRSMAANMAAKGVTWRKADKSPGSRGRHAQQIHKLLVNHDHGTKVPGLVIFKKCTQLIRTLPGIQRDPNHHDDPAEGGDDHWFDSARYAAAYASRGARGIARLREDDLDDRSGQEHTRRGRYGYGSEVC